MRGGFPSMKQIFQVRQYVGNGPTQAPLIVVDQGLGFKRVWGLGLGLRVWSLGFKV